MNKQPKIKRRNKQKFRKQYATKSVSAPNKIYATEFPRTMKVKLVYLEALQTATTNGLNLDRVFNLNSGFDPYRTGTGHQPRGWDQWAAMYNRYRVDTTYVSVSWTNAPSDGAVCSILASNDATNITDLSDVVESPFSVWKAIQLGGPAIVIKKTYNLAAITGVPQHTYQADDRYSALTSSDPAEVIALHVGFNCKTAFTTDVYVVMEMYITFFDPFTISAS
jgi:hypothetical protein